MYHTVDGSPQKVIKSKGNNTHNQAGSSRYQCFPNTAGQHTGINIPLQRLDIHKGLNHSSHRASKTYERGHTSNSCQPVHALFKVEYLFFTGITDSIFNIANRATQPPNARLKNT